MPLIAEDQERIESFRIYIEDSLATDDRYGPAARQDQPEQSRFISSWVVAPSCWFEIEVTARPPQVRIRFVTDDAARKEAIEAEIEAACQSVDEFIANAMAEAGLDEPPPNVERNSADHHFSYSVTLLLEELRDLEDDGLRDRIIRMLEGFMIAFAPALAVDDIGD